MSTSSTIGSSSAIPLKRIAETCGKGSVTDDYRARLHAVSVGLRRRCFLLSLRHVSLHRLFRDGSTTCGVSFHLFVESLTLTSRSPDLQIWLMTNDNNMIQYRVLVSLKELSLHSIFGLYAFKRFNIDYWRSRRSRCQWRRRRLFLDVLNQHLRALSNRRHSSLYRTWSFDKCVLRLNRKNVVRFKIYEDDPESDCDWTFVIRYTEVYAFISQDVTWICIITKDFIRNMMSEVFISSEWSPVPKVIRTFCKSSDIFFSCPPRFQSVRDEFLDDQRRREQRLQQTSRRSWVSKVYWSNETFRLEQGKTLRWHPALLKKGDQIATRPYRWSGPRYTKTLLCCWK